MIGKLFNRLTLGLGVGYVLGTRAGRERYQQIQRWWDSLLGNPTVRQAAERARELASEAGDQAASKLPGIQRGRQSVQEVMTPSPATVPTTATLVEAASKMRQHDVGAVIVLDDSQRVVGIVTDRDIAVRAVAEGRDPKTTTVGDIASKDLQALSPTDSVADAVRLMRELVVRRLPVVENGRPVGVVSIGDLAQERDPDSVLADISRAPANR
jgi:signal-transduction protein with cAMP-binding, CBS, and nucleotidyltransferase domain